jgi:uncharacterized protein DUF6798
LTEFTHGRLDSGVRLSRRQVAAEVGLVLLVFFLQGAWPVPDTNEAHYLPKAIHYWNPDWVPADAFLDSDDTHQVFYFTFGWLSLWLGPVVLAWTGRLLCWGLLAWAWQRLSFALLPRSWLSILTAAVFVCLQSRFQLAGEWVVGGVEAKGFAYALVLLGMESLVRGRWNRVWLLFGAAGAFHVLVGGWSVVAAGLAWGMLGKDRPTLRSMLPALLGGFVLSLPGVLPAALLTRGVDDEVIRLANQIYVFGRLGHHLVPARFLPADVVRFLLLTAVWIVYCRLAPTGPDWRRLKAFVMGTLLLSLVGVVIAGVTVNRPDLAAGLLRFYWFRLSDFGVPLGVALGAVSMLVWLATVASRARPLADRRFWAIPILGPLTAIAALAGLSRLCWPWHSSVARPEEITLGIATVALWSLIWWRWHGGSTLEKANRWWIGAALAGSLLLAVVAPAAHIASYTWLRCTPTTPRADPPDWHYSPWLEACDWIAEHPHDIPPDARFFTPLHSHTFKWYTGRSEVATWKDVPQDAQSIVDWWDRINEIHTTNSLAGDRQWHGSLAQSFKIRDPDEIERLRTKYEADYLLTVRHPRLDYEVVYFNPGYVIYRLRDRR